MKKLPSFLLFCFFNLCYVANAQYTEVINTNRPGVSQGAFAVGQGILQAEVGPYFGKDKHNLTEMETKTFGAEYEIRFGLLSENLELNLRGDYMSVKQEVPMGGVVNTRSFSNFRSNTIGAKYLLFDPHKSRMFDKPNVYSWKANHGFKWNTLIPAVSIYAGYNFNFSTIPEGYPMFGEYLSEGSPVAGLITQHNWGGTAWVMNFLYDRITEDYDRYVLMFTLTQSVGQRSSIFAEFQSNIDDLYSDEILRFGGGYLVTRDLEVDLSAMVNFKNTPSRFQVGIGAAYRLDLYHVDVKIKDPNSKEEIDEPEWEEAQDMGKEDL